MLNEDYGEDVINMRNKLLTSRDNFENSLKAINLTIEQIVNQSVNEEVETQLKYPLPDNVSNKRNPVGIRNNEIDRQTYRSMTWINQKMNDDTPVKPQHGSTNSNFMAGQIVKVKDPNGSGLIEGTIINCSSLEEQLMLLVTGSNRKITVKYADVEDSIEKRAITERLYENALDENPDKESTTNADGEIKIIEKPTHENDYQINDEYTLKDLGIKVRITDVDSVNGTLKFFTLDGENRIVSATFAQADNSFIKESKDNIDEGIFKRWNWYC